MQLTDLYWQNDPLAEIIDINVDFLQTDPYGFSSVLLLSDFSFDAHSVQIDIGGVAFSAGDYIDVQLITSHDAPAPAILGLMSIGLLGVGAANKRRKALN